MRMRLAIAFLAVLALAGCGTSPQTRYFTLSVAAGPDQAQRAIASPVTVAAVHVPSSLDRSEMVRRTGANSVAISDKDRWTAPLGSMTRRVLSQDLAARLPPDMIIPPHLPVPPHTMRIVVSIAWFGPDANGRVRLDGGWSLLEGGSEKPVLRGVISLKSGAAAEGGDAQAAVMSRLLGRLATRIAASLDTKS